MIHSNPNPPMTHDEVLHFTREMTRQLQGNLTARERELLARRDDIYNAIIEANGGRNPLLGI